MLSDIETLYIFAEMERKILTYGGYFERFMELLSEGEKQKIKYGLLLLKSLDKIPNTMGIFSGYFSFLTMAT